MDCLRCHGMMVVERFDEVKGSSLEMSFYGWRCVCCGDIVDPVITANRLKPPLHRGNKSRQRLLVADALKYCQTTSDAA